MGFLMLPATCKCGCGEVTLPGRGRAPSAYLLGHYPNGPKRDTSGNLLCRRCRRYLPPDAFSTNGRSNNRRVSRCKECRASVEAERLASPDYRQFRNAESSLARERMRFGVDGGRDLMLQIQGEVCAWQTLYPGSHGHPEHVDHDHGCACGRKGGCPRCVRAILCRSCNIHRMVVLEELCLAGQTTPHWFQEWLQDTPGDRFRALWA